MFRPHSPAEQATARTFHWMLVLSILLHGVLLALLILGSRLAKSPPPRQEPIIVDLADVPSATSSSTGSDQQTRRFAEERRRVAREMAPRGQSEEGRSGEGAKQPRFPLLPRFVSPGQGRIEAGEGGTIRSQPGTTVPLERLFPNAERMASLEEGYRRKYGPEVAEGNTRFLNSDDILFGSFLRRFETAIYGAWRYPTEAVRLGIEGTVPVRITFNRQGKIVKAEVLESSGSRVLDDEVLRTLKEIGVVGPLPRLYDRDEFHLIAFFSYTIVGGQRSVH